MDDGHHQLTATKKRRREKLLAVTDTSFSILIAE